MEVNLSILKSTLLIFLAVLLINFEAKSQFFKKKVDSSKEHLQEAEYFFSEGSKEYILDNYAKSLVWFEKSLSLNSKSAATNYMIAQIYNKQGNLYKAIQFSQKALELDESNKYYHLLLGQTYERKQDFNEAAKVYLNLIKKLPNTAEYNYDLANVYIVLNKLEEAIKCYDRIEKAFGISEEIIKQKQQIYLKLGKIDEAIAQGKRLIEAYPDEPAYIIMQVEILITNERTNEAEKLINELLVKEPNNPFGMLALSDIYRSKGESKKARELLEKAFSTPELKIDAKIGILISKINQFSKPGQKDNTEIKDECIALGNILVKVHPIDAKALAMNADILTLSGQSKEALEFYLKSIKLDNSHYKVWQQIALLDHELNLIDSMKSHSEKALELFPNQTIFWYYNGLANQMKHNYKKSSNAFEEGKKLAGNDKTWLIQYNSLLGDSYNGAKDYKRSDEAFEEALKLDADNNIVLNNYSYYLSIRKEKLDYARKMSERVVKENPDNATYLDTYAWILYVMKDYGKSKEIFEKIIDKSDNGTIVEHYGDVLFQLGDIDKALEQWKKAKQLGEVSEKIDKKIADKKLYE